MRLMIFVILITLLFITSCSIEPGVSFTNEELNELPEDDPAKLLSIEETNFAGQATKDSTLTSKQKRAFWGCWKENCQAKLKEAQQSKKYVDYRICSLDCLNSVQEEKKDFCEDSDGLDYKNKGKIKTNDYLSGLQYDCQKVGDNYECSDKCFNVSSEKTYLAEMKCENNNPTYIQKNCNELGEGFFCKEGLCVEKEKPKIFEGDGTYLIGEGDIITANNGVSLKVIKILNDIGPEFYDCCGTYNLYYDIYIGENKITLLPQQYQWSKFLESYFINWGIKIEAANKHVVVGDKEKLNVTIISVEEGPITSCQDLYDLCLGYGYNKGSCSFYCANEPLEGELIKKKDNVVVFTEPDYDAYADYILDQTYHCKEELKKVLSIDPFVDEFYVRVFKSELGVFLTGESGLQWSVFGDDPEYYNSQEPKGYCDDETIAHELVHYFTMPFPIQSILDEGFATYMQHKTGVLEISSLSSPPESAGGNLFCGEFGFKGLSSGSCTFECALNCEIMNEESPYLKMMVGGSLTYQGYNLFLDEIGYYTYKLTVKKGDQIASKILPIGKEMFFDDHTFILGDLETPYEGELWAAIAVLENDKSSCFAECVSECPQINDDGSIKYSDLYEGYTWPLSHSYATAYCFFNDVEKQFGFSVMEEFQNNVKKEQLAFGSLCMDNLFPSLIGNNKYKEISLKYLQGEDKEYHFEELCGGVGIIKSGNQWTKE